MFTARDAFCNRQTFTGWSEQISLFVEFALAIPNTPPPSSWTQCFQEDPANKPWEFKQIFGVTRAAAYNIAIRVDGVFWTLPFLGTLTVLPGMFNSSTPNITLASVAAPAGEAVPIALTPLDIFGNAMRIPNGIIFYHAGLSRPLFSPL